MPTEITMPQLGESITEGTVGGWLKREGDPVKKYEPLCEVITDKVNAEIPAPATGVLQKILVEEGTTVAVGAAIAVMEVDAAPKATSAAAGTQEPGEAAAGGMPAETPVQSPAASPEPAVAQRTGEAVAGTAATVSSQTDRGVYSPVVRRLSREHDIDPGTLQGTGAGGRVTRDDVLAAVASQGETPVDGVAEETVIEPTPMRRAIAQRMARSVREIPHAWTMVEVDVTELVRWRGQIKEDFRRREGVDLTYLPFFIKAAVGALKEFPLLNATWRDDRVVVKGRLHIGVAVGLDDGLLVPVIRDADRRSVADLAREITRLTERSRSGQLGLDEVQGGTFTINNTGSFGSVVSMPIINHPQAAILTMEAIVKRPVVIGEGIAVRSMVHVCISFDHRVTDGLYAGRFLQAVSGRLQTFGPDTPLY